MGNSPYQRVHDSVHPQYYNRAMPTRNGTCWIAEAHSPIFPARPSGSPKSPACNGPEELQVPYPSSERNISEHQEQRVNKVWKLQSGWPLCRISDSTAPAPSILAQSILNTHDNLSSNIGLSHPNLSYHFTDRVDVLMQQKGGGSQKYQCHLSMPPFHVELRRTWYHCR